MGGRLGGPCTTPGAGHRRQSQRPGHRAGRHGGGRREEYRRGQDLRRGQAAGDGICVVGEALCAVRNRHLGRADRSMDGGTSRQKTATVPGGQPQVLTAVGARHIPGSGLRTAGDSASVECQGGDEQQAQHRHHHRDADVVQALRDPPLCGARCVHHGVADGPAAQHPDLVPAVIGHVHTDEEQQCAPQPRGDGPMRRRRPTRGVRVSATDRAAAPTIAPMPAA